MQVLSTGIQAAAVPTKQVRCLWTHLWQGEESCLSHLVRDVGSALFLLDSHEAA